jgi:hypothetical protein
MGVKTWFGWLLVIMSLTALSSAATQEVSVAGSVGPTGYGSTGVYARVFETVIAEMGTAIKYVSDPVNGDSFVIQSSGIYAVSYTDANLGDGIVGISLNVEPTTSFQTAYGTAQELCAFYVDSTQGIQSCSATLYLSKGDVIRAHSSFVAPPGTESQSATRLIVTKI